MIQNDIKNDYFCYVRCTTLLDRVGGMPWSITGAILYHAQLGLPDKGRANKEFDLSSRVINLLALHSFDNEYLKIQTALTTAAKSSSGSTTTGGSFGGLPNHELINSNIHKLPISGLMKTFLIGSSPNVKC